MAVSINKVFVQTYETNVRHLAQQGITRLRPWVMEKSVQSEGHNWERMGQATASQKTSRKAPTPDNQTPWSRRKSIPTTWDVGDVTEQEDIVQMIVDPNSNYSIAQGKAMRRAHDDALIEAAVGASRDGDGVSVPFLASQSIGSATAAFNFELITSVTEKFMDNDIDPDEPKVFVVAPWQAKKLLEMTQATSGDYNAVRPLTSKGYIESWMGYSWIVSTRLQQPIAGQWYGFAMTKKAIGLQMNRDITSRISEDPSISFAWRIYSFSSFGAIRVEDEHVVRTHTLATA